ncbi:MAG: efflux RND transporter permease subunit [Candidatus Eremiobacteraeota bacterium]|nr:efflux RND transporter permease subunit [Candidatus Eremiobacteraeota bacterium]
MAVGLARFAVNRRVAVSMIALAFIVLGIFAIPRLPVALLPSFSPPVITVTVNYPNVGPYQIESLVTRPIENAVSRVNGIEMINSTSEQGQSQVRATFHYGTNLDTAAVDVQQQIDRIRNQLPNDPTLQQPQIFKFDANSLPVIRGYVTDPNYSLRDLGSLFTNQIADEFSAVNGVAQVSIGVDQQRAVMVEPDANLLAANGLSLDQLVTRIGQENVNLPAGIIRVGTNEYQVRTNALFKNAAQIGEIVVATKNGVPIYLHDVASVKDAIEEQRSFERLDGKPALGITINAQPDANIVATAAGIYGKIAQLEKRYPGMHIGIVFGQRTFILQAVNALEHTAIYGAILAVLVIFLFLHSWRSTLVVAISLPISVLGTLFGAYVFGYSLNVMTLGGLALAVGLIVDDAIVVIENIARHRAMSKDAKTASIDATGEILTAVIASSITVITVFVPLVLIPGLQGLIFTPFAVMVMVAVALSLLVAVTTVPMLSSLAGNDIAAHGDGAPGNGAVNGARNGKVSRDPFKRFAARFETQYARFERTYRSLLAHAVDRPRLVAGIALLLVIATVGIVKLGLIPTETFPPSNSRYVRFFLRTPNGTALAITNAEVQKIEKAMLRDPRVQNVGIIVGTQGLFNALPVTNQATLSVTLKSNIVGDAAAAYVAQWQKKLEKIPGLLSFGHTVDIVSNIISRGQSDLDIQIYGPSFTKLYSIAKDQVLPAVEKIRGISRPDLGITATQPELDVNIKRTTAARLGVSTADISQTIDTATAGSIASYLQIDGTQYPIVVQLPPSQRRSEASIAMLGVPLAATSSALSQSVTPSAPLTQTTLPTMPLGELANLTFGVGPSEITRQNKQREMDVTATLLNAPLGQVVDEATAAMSRITLPPGYSWQFGQSVTDQANTFASLGLIVALAILLVYMLLAAQFESLLHPLVIMLSVPLASIGVVLALLLTHRSFGLTAFIGVLMLVGIVVKNAILVVEFTNRLRARGLSAREAVLQAAPLRLRPIVMTTLATVGGMLPIAIGIEQGSQTQAPLGTVVIGGLLVSTTLSLLVIPTLYLWAATNIEPRMHRRAGGAIVVPPSAEHEPAGV